VAINRTTRHIFSRIVLIVGASLLFTGGCLPDRAMTPGELTLPPSTLSVASSTPAEPTETSLGPTPTSLGASGSRPWLPHLGIATTSLDQRGGLDQMVTAGAYWARPDALLWSEVEPSRGLRNWGALSDLEQELRDASRQGMEVILIVHSTPAWAQHVAGSYCGPIRPDALEDFAAFMRDLVARYSAAPFNVKYWELWNEPDVDPALVGPRSVFGCWGDMGDAYYGGGHYAEMLKAVYPQIKAADPQAKVLVGGLMLDCSPEQPPEGQTCVASRFLEGVLEAEGGRYFDGVSFHAYDFYLGEIGMHANANWHSAWNTSGPALIAKARYLTSLMASYGVTEKFLMSTETALLCGRSGKEQPCQTEAFENSKAYYVAQVASASAAEGLKAVVWYSLHGWRASGLVDRNLEPLPAYDAYQFASTALRDAVSQGQITAFAGVNGYAFERGEGRLWVLWSLHGETHLITLPSEPAAVYDVYGDPLEPSANLEVSLGPIYIEWEQ